MTGPAIDDPFARYHDEVVAALAAVGDPRYGKSVAVDRRSALEYLGVGVPDQRAIVRKGFSFFALPADEVLAVWDALWRRSPYGEVLFAALEYYLPLVRKRPDPALWPVVRGWVWRVDNWSHADGLAGLYSRLLEAFPSEVYPQLQTWNAASEEWLRRISIVSLIHYSGKNAVFLPPERVLPLVSSCLDDHRESVQKAIGWVLREMGHRYRAEIRTYLAENGTRMSAAAFSRAIERRSPDERSELRRLRSGP